MDTILARRIVAILAFSLALASTTLSQYSYPELKFEQISDTRIWKISPDYPVPNPPPLQIRLNDSTVLEYTILSGYETNFRSGPKFLDLLAKQTGPNNLNLAWLIHDINYDGYVKDRIVADRLLYSMLLSEIGRIRAAAVYYGVRLFGEGHYCKEEKPEKPCASNPYIRFKKVTISTHKGGQQSIKLLPTLELQTLRLTLMTDEDRDKVREEIKELFQMDADAVLKEFEKDNP